MLGKIFQGLNKTQYYKDGGGKKSEFLSKYVLLLYKITMAFQAQFMKNSIFFYNVKHVDDI